MTKNATVIRERGINLDGEHHSKGSVLRLPCDQFNDLRCVGIVREATDAEVDCHGEKAAAEKPARKRQAARVGSTATGDSAPSATD